ncbi:receptor kinase-like protein Xa21 isoform X2 [Impatiens glandulifera]|uniref:receptor kinase-like protein Xa21 isoform X2 n=2 Tax=Impatiens glandulifera TaxID=253017 RepID=UPI001FB085DC|nr:receptor kinase-like protein Xa21 isoform X2 [Impatiens glandulifera]
MGNNQLPGTIPLSLFNVSSLQTIILTDNDLSGELPADLCHYLPELEGLFLSLNQFEGPILSSIGSCSKLLLLDLSFNRFIGQIPMEIGNLTNLQVIRITSNSLTGAIPHEMGKLVNLKQLYLWRNGLTGPIPNDIWNSSSLSLVNLGENNFTGAIPEELGRLRNLKTLSIEVNKLTGSIPESIFNSSKLQILSLASNQLSGNLPPNLGLSAPNLKQIYLGINQFSGVIPNSISNASNLIFLELSLNQFSGPIPSSLGDLRLLQHLNLYWNYLTGDPSSQELKFLGSLTNCRYLTRLWIAENLLNGILPSSIGNLSMSLQSFFIYGSGIKGQIPPGIGNLTRLESLYIYNNDLTGSLPGTLKELRNLQALSADNNRLQGSIPNWICVLRALSFLTLDENEFSGPLPSCLANISFLRQFHVSSNRLVSNIPSNIFSLPNLLELGLSNNSFSGNLSPDIGNLKAATDIDMSYNKLSGELPSTIGGLTNLIELTLSNNKFQGTIPESLGNMLSLEDLDLSENELSGAIPKSLEALIYLKSFNVSFNHLRGDIPSKGPFLNFSNASFIGNEALCGSSILQLQYPPCTTSSLPWKKKHNHLIILYILLPIGVVLFIIFLVMLRTWSSQRSKNKIDQQGSLPSPLKPLERISYDNLFCATEGFSHSNLIGVGGYSSVYKGLHRDGTIIAVKVFDLKVEGGFRSFDTECEVLKSIQHRNIVGVLTSCSRPDFRALVLEYMPNGSLDKWLYSHNYFLDMLKRLDIMIDVACALEYLHYGFISPLAHCDLKPSNVLLDQDMVGHISDFGISKLLSVDDSIAQTRTLATIGYIAPEYGREGLVSIKCDVYSYGIMLMETFTRTRPTDERFDEEEGLSLKKWVKDSSVEEIIDSNLVRMGEKNINGNLECVSAIMDLALACSAESPGERVDIKVVLTNLRKIRHFIG